MKQKAADPGEDGKSKLWQKTPYANLLRYLPNGMYFYRIRVRGRLIRRSLKTDVLSVAKLRLTDEEKKHRQAVQQQTARRSNGPLNPIRSSMPSRGRARRWRT